MTAANLKLVQMHRIKAAGLNVPRLTRFLTSCACDWALIVGAYGLAVNYFSVPTILLAIIVIGNRQHALAALVHEGAHYLATRNRKLNDVVTLLFCALPLGMHIQPYRKFHFAHHRLSGKPQDPELKHVSAKAQEWSGPLTLRKIGGLALKDVFLFQGAVNLGYIIQLARPTPMQGALIAGYLMALHGALILSGHWLFSVLWYGALLTTFWAFFRIRIWTEHRGTDATHRIQLSRWVAALISPHLMWYHYEHHAFPQIPSYHLPEIRALLGPDPKVISLKEWFRQMQTAGRPLAYVHQGKSPPTTNSHFAPGALAGANSRINASRRY